MNNQIKHIVEAFDFNSINKDKKHLNISDIVIKNILNKVAIKDKTIDDLITKDEYNILISFTGIYPVKDIEELKSIIGSFIANFGNECNLNWIDVSNITDFSDLFWGSTFNGDISKWDVSNATNMYGMFSCSKAFQGDLSSWDVSNVTNMERMFMQSTFNGNISTWDVSNVTNMRDMFETTKFNGDISKWDVSSVTDMTRMFAYNTSFNQDISSWDVSSVISFQEMFYSNTAFNKDLSKWNINKIINAEKMFARSNYNKESIYNWNVSVSSNLKDMFKDCPLKPKFNYMYV